MFSETTQRLHREFGPPTVKIERWHVEVPGGVRAPVTVSVSPGREPGTSDVWVFCVGPAQSSAERITRSTIRGEEDIESLIRLIRKAAGAPTA